MDRHAAEDATPGTSRAPHGRGSRRERDQVPAREGPRDARSSCPWPPWSRGRCPSPAWDRVAAAGLAPAGGTAAGERSVSRPSCGATSSASPSRTSSAGYERNVRLLQAQYLRCHHPRGWRPDIRLEGREHLDRALGAGRGAIVWRAPFVFATLVTKMALHAAGYGLVHLSRLGHGYSPTRFGVRVLNPVRTRAEDRYLAERVVIGARPLQAAMRTLARRLAANRVVSIAAGAQGVKTCAAPFLGGELRVATGAPNLALRTGAPLLPVFTVREGPGRFLTVIEPPLEARARPPGASRRRRTLSRRLVARIEHHARRWPDQFHWHPEITGRLRSSE